MNRIQNNSIEPLAFLDFNLHVLLIEHNIHNKLLRTKHR